MMNWRERELLMLVGKFTSKKYIIDCYYRTSTTISENELDRNSKKEIILGPHRVLPGRLSVSRTFGDLAAKIEKHKGNPKVVVALPDIKSFRI